MLITTIKKKSKLLLIIPNDNLFHLTLRNYVKDKGAHLKWNYGHINNDSFFSSERWIEIPIRNYNTRIKPYFRKREKDVVKLAFDLHPEILVEREEWIRKTNPNWFNNGRIIKNLTVSSKEMDRLIELRRRY